MLKVVPVPYTCCPQVSVHIKGTTECYECHPPPSGQKTYPICTLRNTPDKPIHCVVWAKELLFPRLFGKVEASGGLGGGEMFGGVGTRGGGGKALVRAGEGVPQRLGPSSAAGRTNCRQPVQMCVPQHP
jgi:hypothetical protein